MNNGMYFFARRSHKRQYHEQKRNGLQHWECDRHGQAQHCDEKYSSDHGVQPEEDLRYLVR